VILLDTNLLSELLRPSPNAKVLAWFDDQPRASLFTTTITQAELLYGVELLPDGQRKATLMQAVLEIFSIDMAGRVLAFDAEATRVYATIAAQRKNSGSPASQFDAMIASIAFCHGATLATRNVKDFHDCGIELVNPWE
jgi:predicted nucleic acid-binding protein